MSLMINGVLRDDDWFEASNQQGEYIRKDSQFRNWITVDGSAGPTGEAGFKAEPGRYHLYVSHACPWAHRTLIFRKLKKLEDVISVDVVHPHMGYEGWSFGKYPGATGDSNHSARFLHELYRRAQRDYSGIVTVPVLWDKQRETIVNNESSEIIRMLNSAFDQWGDTSLDFYPEPLRSEIDHVNDLIYHTINNGVYKAGFATTQDAYTKHVEVLFSALDVIEHRLSHHRYLIGNRITEADWRLFTTLVRFDAVYVGHFKCNLKRIADYPNLGNYLRDLYQQPGIAETVNMEHIRQHYYWSHTQLNPTRIVPIGPELDLMASHDRARFDK